MLSMTSPKEGVEDAIIGQVVWWMDLGSGCHGLLMLDEMECNMR
jgi:hypothetical protein